MTETGRALRSEDRSGTPFGLRAHFMAFASVLVVLSAILSGGAVWWTLEGSGTDRQPDNHLDIWKDQTAELLRSLLAAKPLYQEIRLLQGDVTRRELLRVIRQGNPASAASASPASSRP